MTKQETINLIKKIKAYYPIFRLEEEGIDEWALRLKPYEYQDVLDKLEEHLKGEKAEEPPKLHFITRYLKTKEEKEKYRGDYLVRCNLCGREMFLKELEETHYEKCLCIKALIPILRARGDDVSYEILDEYDFHTLDRLWDKYGIKNNNLDKTLEGFKNG